MSAIKTLLDSLLWDIYGEQRQQRRLQRQTHNIREPRLHTMSASVMGVQRNVRALEKLDVRKLIDVCAILKVEIRLMAYLLERVLISRDRNHRIQDVLCGFVDAIIHVEYHDVHPRMRFSLSPPSPKVIFSTNVTPASRCGSEFPSAPQSQHQYPDNNNTINCYHNNMQRQEDNTNLNANQPEDSDTSSDYKQWLHAMKLVARLPGGIPPEFRRKLWLSLADKYLKSKNVDWDKEEEKCFCEKWREDDEELGIQIVKDLHRTGSTLCTGPAGDVNQAKLKRILLGYARYNPEVGYCQGFNMLGALILQVMDKEEAESIKVMIYLVEGILPTGYFCGSMGGLQADMAVFRELMQTKLPRLAKHLQKLQGPMENAYEPPLTNVFTMQWFLTMFCTCLPMSCVLRVWDLVLIEGSDVLLRTALALWSLLEERVLSTRSADDFYGKMGSFSSELLNGHLIDSNGLIEKVVQLGPISDIQKLRDKHLYNIAPLRHQQGLHLYYDDDEPDIDEDSRLAVATVWGIPWGRRGSQGQTATIAPKQAPENKDRIALDISLLKKQYDRLRERQKQAHIILTTACSSARQGTVSNTSTAPLPVNQLLSGRPAIVTNKGRRSGPPTGAIPPARKPSLPAVLQDKPLEKRLRRGETLHWRDTSNTIRRRESLTWKEIKAERKALITSGSIDGLKSQKIQSRRLGKSDSSSYSEESDDNEDDDGSTSDTSFCDEENLPSDEMANSQKTSSKFEHKTKKKHIKQRNMSVNIKEHVDRERPKSWAPSYSDIPFVLMTMDSPTKSSDENHAREFTINTYTDSLKEEEKSAEENDEVYLKDDNDLSSKDTIHSPIDSGLAILKAEICSIQTNSMDKFQASPFPNKNIVLANKTHLTESTSSLGSGGGEEDEVKTFDVSDEGVTNEYFERVNSTDRPTKLDLLYSLNEEESIRDAYNVVIHSYKAETEQKKLTMTHDDTLKNSRCMDLLVDYSEKSSAACIAEAKSEISTTLQTVEAIAAHSIRTDLTIITDELVLKRPIPTAAEKRRNPRRLTLTRSSTMDIEKRYQALEKRLSMEISSLHMPLEGENYIAFNEKSLVKERQIKSDETEKTHKEHINIYQSEINEHRDNDDQSDTKRKIPSTEDLEERFNIMKLHLVSERTDKIASACDSESPGQQKNGEPCKMSTTQQSMERDLNVNKNDDQADKKEDPDIETNNTNEEKPTIPESDIEHEASTINDNKETSNNIESESNESKSVINKTNLLPSKKEPPDIKRNDSILSIKEKTIENNSIIEAGTQDANEMSTENQAENPQSKNEKVPSAKSRNITTDELLNNNQSTDIPTDNPNSEELKEKTLKKLEHIKQETLDMNHESKEPKTDEGIDSTHTVPRKSPPSTEELEKRFSALEKQMIGTKNQTNETQFNSPIDRLNKTLDEGEAVCNENTTSEKIKESVDKTPKNSTAIANTDIEKTSNNINEKSKSINTQTITSASQKLGADSTKRRLSEPPSTEDLERRYEVVKRRMSSRQFTTKSSTEKRTFVPTEGADIELLDSENVKLPEDSVTKISSTSATPNEQGNDYRSPNGFLEKRTEKLQSKTDKESNNTTNKPSPPSTENLEKRYEELQKKERSNATAKDNSPTKHSPPSTENLEKRYAELQDNSKKKPTNDLAISKSNETKEKQIQKAAIKSPAFDNGSRQKRSALLEELQTKFKANASGEQVKPSSINPARRPTSKNNLLASQSFNDGTSETHATSAYSISGKYEPMSSSKRKMVRRFSDLPSRADLENRLQFLEERLSKTLSKPRRSSDSEVASKHHRSKHNIQLSQIPLNGSLEYRVLELEKYLKENRTLSMDVECTQTHEKHTQDPEIKVAQIELAADNVAVTGKELVRYSQFGEVTELNHQNPINISINIQMTLPKDDNENKKLNDLPKAEELDKRMQILEQQLKKPLPFNDPQAHKNDSKSLELSMDGKENLADISQKPDDVCEANIKSAMGIENTEMLNEKSSEFHENNKETNEIVQVTNLNCEKETETFVSTKSTDHVTSKTAADNTKHNNNVIECKETIESSKQSITEPEITEDTSTKNKANEYKKEPTTEMKSSDNLNLHDKRTRDQSESNNQYDIETKNAKDLQSNDKHNFEVNESEELTKIENSLITKTSNCDEPKSSTIENKVENEIQSNTQNAEVNETEMTNVIQNNIIENNKEIVSEVLRAKIDYPDKTSTTLEASQMVPIEVNKKTLVLLLDNEPKSVKVRRLTRANTEELEDLFQALEKQLTERSQEKSDETPMQSNEKLQKTKLTETELTQAMADLTKEIHEFSKSEKTANIPAQKEKLSPKKQEEDFDWGIDPNKYHLKKKTVYLPSTKELEARFRSLERQIKVLEDVEKIDVEQRLIEIERKIKLQYSLSHEKDLNKFLELCEGKILDEVSPSMEKQHERKDCTCNVLSDNRQYTSSSKHTSPKRSTAAKSSTDNLEHRYRALDHKRSMSKQVVQKEPIHRLEILLDPSPDECSIPTTGELEHRMRVMENRHCTPSPPSRKSRSQSPPQQHKVQTNKHTYSALPSSPAERELPTAEELEARLDALEKTQCFDFKMQKNFQHFNQKLKDVISPSLSFDEFHSNKSGESESKNKIRTETPKSDVTIKAETTSPKTIRFRDEVHNPSMHRSDDNTMVSTNNNVIQILEENSKMIQRILKKTIADTHSNILGRQPSTAVQEGLGVMGIRLMRETSPLRRKGTHTGVPLRTGENINDQLTSIKNTIKSINSLCEEKPYRKERCQQYIDALFSDSTYFATKKSSLEDLATLNASRSTSREIGPSIRISDHSPAFTRSMGSADSIRSTSPSKQISSLQYRSNRDLRREPSPRRRRDEDREEHESRVRRDTLLPNNINCNHSTLSHSSHSLTKFHKVDSQLISNDIDVELELEERLRHPTDSSIESMVTHDNTTNTSNTVNTPKSTSTNEVTTSDPLKTNMLDWPISPYRQTNLTNSKTPVYSPAKLEIRHTTVTSTFYDRVLTEKQLEKQHSVTANRSPMVSPLYERPVRPCSQISISPPKLPYQETTNTMILSQASAGNYRIYQPNIHANNG